MTVAALVIATKPNSISFRVSYDGGAGTTLNITNAQLAAAAPPGRFREFLRTDWAGNNVANARLRLLGNGAPAVLGGMGPSLKAVDHCRAFVRRIPGPPAIGTQHLLLVDAAVDGADADRVMLTLDAVEAGANAKDWQVDVEYQLTQFR